MTEHEPPLLRVDRLTKWYGRTPACTEVTFELWPGEVLAVVGESGSGKTTLLRCIAGDVEADQGRVLYRTRHEGEVDLLRLSAPRLRLLMRTDVGFVHQNPRDGLRLQISAGANIGERLMAVGARHYGRIRGTALDWMARVELEAERIDDRPRTFSGGMQQRLQIARNLVNQPRLLLMDEPTGGLDVSVQARLLDLLRTLAAELGLAVVIVTHDLGVARLLSDRMLVMQRSRVVETGLTDQVLDDPQHPYSQLLVASILPT